MKIWLTRSIILHFFIILSSYSMASANDDLTFHQWGSLHSKWYYNSIKETVLKKMPFWDPSSGEPPLLPTEALKIAQQYLAINHPSIKKPKIRNIELIQFLVPKYIKNKWYYVIDFWYNFPAKSGVPENIKVVVMLDGSINKSLTMPKK